MKPFHTLALAALLALPATAVAQEAQGYEADAPAAGDIIETADAAGSFTTLAKAIEAAGLTETLKGDGPFTVFAPTDDAFAALPQETVQGLLHDPPALARVLTYHVVPGRITSAQITHDSEQKTVEGGLLKIAVNGGVTVNDASVIQADVQAENGVIHVIDRVLIPAA
jgi:uncharacterized surface protein with fasciclin (FAS1) repeats